MAKRDAAFLADLRARRAERDRQRTRAVELFAVTGIILVTEDKHETFMILHPSTVIPDGWQVSLFGRDGPFSHDEGATRDEAIGRAFEHRDLSDVRPVTEAEFMAVSQTPEFSAGVTRCTYTGLCNRISFEFGYARASGYFAAARNADTMERAIAILLEGLEALQQQDAAL